MKNHFVHFELERRPSNQNPNERYVSTIYYGVCTFANFTEFKV